MANGVVTEESKENGRTDEYLNDCVGDISCTYNNNLGDVFCVYEISCMSGGGSDGPTGEDYDNWDGGDFDGGNEGDPMNDGNGGLSGGGSGSTGGNPSSSTENSNYIAVKKISLEDAISKFADLWERQNVTLSDAFKSNPCLKNVWENLQDSHALYSMLSVFINNSFDLNINLNFDIAYRACNNVTYNACTDPGSSSEISIILKQSYVDRASPESIARTILHEAIHAHLIYYLRIIENVESVDWGDFPGLWYYMEKNNYYLGRASHEQMAAYYLEVIQFGLQEFDRSRGISPRSTFYRAMSWAGLHGQPGYNSDYDSIIEEEENKGGCN